MTTDHRASRTLVKSPPELWAECSDPGALARHIGEFGEIRITRLDPETSIAWEAERAVGTVEIEPSGWGTKVTLTAQTQAEEDGQEEVDAGIPIEEPAEIDNGEEPIAIREGATDTSPAPPPAQADPVEEDSDAKVEEETVAESDPAVAAGPVAAGGRWRRLIKRTRTWFKPDPAPVAAVTEPGPPAPEPPAPEPAAVVEAIEAPEALDEPAGASEPEAFPPTAPEPEAAAPEAPEPTAPEPAAPSEVASEDAPAIDPEAILTAALDSLGQAHHRPFSRA